MEKAQVTLPNDREVKVVRSFRAPRALVYRAFTEPKLVRKWLGGHPGWTMPVCEMDVRAGGRYRWRWRSDADGKEFGFFGTFSEIDAPKRIVHTETFDPGNFGGEMGECVVTTELMEAGGITTMKTSIVYASKEARDGAIKTGMTDGMELSYQNLDRLVADPSLSS